MKRSSFARSLALATASMKVRVTTGAVAALVVGIVLITLLMMQRLEKDLLQTDRRRESSLAIQTAALLSRKVVSLQRALQVTALQLDGPTLEEHAALQRFIDSKAILHDLYDSIFVASVEGSVYSRHPQSTVSTPELSIADRDYFRQTLAEGRAIISAPVAGRVSGEPVLVFTQPVRQGSGIAAVLGGSLRLSNRDLLEGLAETQDTDDGALVVVTDATGRILAHPDRKRVMQSLSSERRLGSAFAAWHAMGSPVEPLGLLLPQQGEVVSAAGVPGPDWVVWRSRPEAELLVPLRSARHYALGWAAALVVVLSSGLLALLWWLLRPLTLLQRRSQHLFDGTMAPRVGWPSARGEIGALERVLRHVAAERAEWEVRNARLLGRLGSVMSAAPVGIVFTRDERFELVSAELCRMFGRSEPSFLEQPSRLIFASADDHVAFSTQERAAFLADQAYVGDWQMVRADGSRFWARVRSKPVDPDDLTLGAIWSVVDFEKQKSVLEQLEWSASHDVLTGLSNRQVLQQRAQQMLDELPRILSAAMIFIDLDNFKPVNDTAGHVAGDQMLRLVADAITGSVRQGDLVTRLGGDEFALLLANCSEEVALRVARQILNAVAAVEVPWNDVSLRVNASIGVAALTPEMDTVAAWVMAADAACYAAKAAGRGRVVSTSSL